MTVQTDEDVRELVDFAPDEYLVTSFYLNVDATEFPDPDHVLKSFDSLIHAAESRRKEIEDTLSHDAKQSIRNDLARLRALLSDGYDRQDTNGLAIFSCSALDFWHVFQLPKPVQSRIEFEPTCHVAPIATFLSHAKPTAILVTDKKNARVFTMSGANVREWVDLQEWVPQRSSQGGWSQSRYQRRSDNFAKHHIDYAADLAFKVLQRQPFDWLVLGTQEQYRAEVMKTLHPYLRDRIIGEIHVRIDAGVAEIVEQARSVAEQAESRRIHDLMAQIIEFAGAGGRGTIGLMMTLEAVNEQKVNVLLVQEGYSHPGSKCLHCGLLMMDQKSTCDACNEAARPVDDIIDETIQQCVVSGAVVEIATEYQQLEPIQNIGSIMYY
jgi:peptide subunit release factor 1 (eRF1)